LIDDLRQHSLTAAIRNLGRSLLILHSPMDELVDIDHARRIFEAARHPKSFVSLDDADHLLLKRERDARYAADVLVAWAGRYLDGIADAEALPVEEGNVVVQGPPEGLQQHIVAGPHVLTADEPERLGGTDTGPTPYDLLMASLGSCISMTLRLYARRKQWPLKDVEVRLFHDRIHARDCADCETKEGRVDQVTVELAVSGPLRDDQRERLLEIAGKCPVHRTLTREIKIRKKLVA
jgi:putative redox protein